jgi:glutathione peroxidase
MRKPILPILLWILLAAGATQAQTTGTLYSIPLAAANGGQINLAQYAGKKILIVNTASLGPENVQLGKLQTLFTQNSSKLVIIAIPCSDFNNLEPEQDNAKIWQHYTQVFQIGFPIAAKTATQAGAGMHPLYAWLTSKEKNGVLNSRVKKNFQKYLINETGQLCGVFDGAVDPLSTSLQQAIDSQ